MATVVRVAHRLKGATLHGTLLALVLLSGGRGARGSEEDAPRAPVRYGGITLEDGTLASAHVGLLRPPAAAEATGRLWRLRQAATVRRRGRAVKAYQYAVPVEDPEAPLESWFRQVEYVDPSTGRLAGGGAPGALPPASEPGDCGGW